MLAELQKKRPIRRLSVMRRDDIGPLMPSGRDQQELPTTVEDRTVNAPCVLPVAGEPASYSSSGKRSNTIR
jgi:hypothetical protein